MQNDELTVLKESKLDFDAEMELVKLYTKMLKIMGWD